MNHVGFTSGQELNFCEQLPERHKWQIHLFMQIKSEHKKKLQGDYRWGNPCLLRFYTENPEHVYSYGTQGDGVMETQLTASKTQFGIKSVKNLIYAWWNHNNKTAS